MWFLSKNVVLFRLVRFLSMVRDENQWFTLTLKILIPCVATTSIMKWDEIFIISNFGSLIFELRIGLIFQYTPLEWRSWCSKYICILNTIFTTHVQKKFTFQKISIICGEFLIFCQMWFLCIFMICAFVWN